MEVSTNHFSVMPRYDNSQKIKGWQGRASVQLQGLDFPRITAAAARAKTFSRIRRVLTSRRPRSR